MHRFVTASLLLALTACQAPVSAWDTGSLYEIRSYHFAPELLSEYRQWVDQDALPYLASHVDVVGFWIASGDEPEVGGAALDELGSANVTWIIRWDSMAQRAEVWPKVTSGEEFEAIIGKVPGGRTSYRRAESRFANSVPMPGCCR